MKRKNIILLIVLLVIGFASVSTTLVLNGIINIGFNNTDFDVIFTHACMSQSDGDEADNGLNSHLILCQSLSIEKNGKEFSFDTGSLTKVGEKARIYYTVTNNSKNYDANVTIDVIVDDKYEEYKSYVSITQDLTSPFELLSMGDKNGEIIIELIKPFAEDEEASFTYTIKLVASPIERDSISPKALPIYKDSILNGADPTGIILVDTDEADGRDTDMAEEMPSISRSALGIGNKIKRKYLIPVILSDDGEVTYASVHKEWYSYENKEWANAVMLVDSPSKDYETGDVILEQDIEAYFVWIPRYKYKAFTDDVYAGYIDESYTSNAQEIQIEFESVDSEIPGLMDLSDWSTHPIFSKYDINGFWIGKYETSYNEKLTGEEDSDKVLIKPNVTAWTGNNYFDMFDTANGYNRSLSSHMINNSEWGAVAYLSHSKYGINSEIRINNNYNKLTGYASHDVLSSSHPYNTQIGYKASTTGNITGVFDMSGGVLEAVAAYMSSGQNSSGFDEWTLSNYDYYFDVYPYDSNSTSWNKSFLGDAVGELGPFYYDGTDISYSSWYQDQSYFVDSSSPWLCRGGKYDDGKSAGIFSFNNHSGVGDSNIGFRIVLSPEARFSNIRDTDISEDMQ